MARGFASPRPPTLSLANEMWTYWPNVLAQRPNLQPAKAKTLTDNTLPYSTVGGQVTRGETYAQLLDYLKLARDCTQRMSTEHYTTDDYVQFNHNLTMAEEAADVLGHLFNTEDDERSKLMAHGWYGVGEMLHNQREIFRQLATRPSHHNKWRKVHQLFDKIVFQVQKIYEEKRQ